MSASQDDPTPDTRPLVGRYADYRAFLRDMIAWLRAHQRGFSYRSFARKAGFSSPSFLKLVADGHRNLSAESVERVATGLGLDRRETDAFEALVEFGQAESDVRRKKAWAKVLQHTRHDPVRQLEAREFDVYDRWQTLVIRELMTLPRFDRRPEVLARRFRFRTRPAQVRRAIEDLVALGLVEEDADGTLGPTDLSLATPPEVRSLAVRSFHRQILEHAIEALDTVPQGERNITGVTMALNREQYAQVIELIQRLRREALAIAADPARNETPEAPPREVHQLTFALVPLTRTVVTDD